jgi:hypothetical protein
MSQAQPCWDVLVTSLSSCEIREIFVSTHRKYFLIPLLLDSGDNWRFFLAFYFSFDSLGKGAWDICLNGMPRLPQLREGIEISVPGSSLSPGIFRLPFLKADPRAEFWNTAPSLFFPYAPTSTVKTCSWRRLGPIEQCWKFSYNWRRETHY